MDRTRSTARRQFPPNSHPGLRLLSVVPTIPQAVDVGHLEIAYGEWDVFDSDDIDALRVSGAVWMPSMACSVERP